MIPSRFNWSHSLRAGMPAGLEETAQLGRTLWRRRVDILAFFDHHASNGPTEAINGRLEVLRHKAFGFRNSPTTAGADCCTAERSTQTAQAA
jgi:transposase